MNPSCIAAKCGRNKHQIEAFTGINSRQNESSWKGHEDKELSQKLRTIDLFPSFSHMKATPSDI